MTFWLTRPRPKKIPAVGRVAKREGQYRAEWDLIAKRRADGECERCGNDQFGVPLELHHIFGRTGSGAGLGFPWAHLPELIAVLCRACHVLVTNVRADDQEAVHADHTLKELGIERFLDRGIFEGWLSLADLPPDRSDELDCDRPQHIEVIRALVRAAKDRGAHAVVMGETW